MSEESLSELPGGKTELLELGVALGQNQTFGLIAGRCSAAQAEGLRRLREEKLYKQCTEKWEDFCPQFLKISRSEADRTIKIWEEFGAAYFELTQLTRVSADTFRALAPAIQDGVLHYQGEAIELNPENARKVATVVAELRRAAPKRSRRAPCLTQLHGPGVNLADRIARLDQCGAALVAELENISRDEGLGPVRELFVSVLTKVRAELERVVVPA